MLTSREKCSASDAERLLRFISGFSPAEKVRNLTVSSPLRRAFSLTLYLLVEVYQPFGKAAQFAMSARYLWEFVAKFSLKSLVEVMMCVE